MTTFGLSAYTADQRQEAADALRNAAAANNAVKAVLDALRDVDNPAPSVDLSNVGEAPREGIAQTLRATRNALLGVLADRIQYGAPEPVKPVPVQEKAAPAKRARRRKVV